MRGLEVLVVVEEEEESDSLQWCWVAELYGHAMWDCQCGTASCASLANAVGTQEISAGILANGCMVRAGHMPQVRRKLVCMPLCFSATLHVLARQCVQGHWFIHAHGNDNSVHAFHCKCFSMP